MNEVIYLKVFIVEFINSFMVNNEISKEKLEKYFRVTESAFEIVKKSVIKGKEKEAKEIFEMVKNYISDAKHFEKMGDWVLSFAALNYAHGWIDAGVRLDVFQVTDDKLFTVKWFWFFLVKNLEIVTSNVALPHVVVKSKFFPQK